MKRNIKRTLLLVILLIITALVSTSCSFESQEKLWLKTESWSRGVLLGPTTMAAPVDLEISQSGAVYSIIFPRSTEDNSYYQPQLVIIPNDADTKTVISLDLVIGQPRQSFIVLNESDIDFFWIESRQINHMLIGLDGLILSEISNLSGEDFVDKFDVLRQGDNYQIWYAGNRDTPGVYALSGDLGDLKKTVIDPLGTRINILLDSDNNIHASWVQYPHNFGELGYYYAFVDQEDSGDVEPVKINAKNVSTSIRMVGPVLSLDDEVVYIIWSEEITSGLEAGTKTTFYQYFPLGQPDKIRPQMNVYMPASPNIDQEEVYSGVLPTGNRVSMGGVFPRTSNIENVYSLDLQLSETAIVFRSGSEFKWRDFRNQVNIGYLSDGLITSYQPLSYTSAESYFPAVFHDQEQYLYLSWLEKGESTYYAYLTTTDPDKKAGLDIMSVDDYLYLGAEGLFGFLAGAVLSPFAAAAWGGVGLLAFSINLIFSLFNKQIYKTIGEYISLVGSIYIFWWMKWATLPGLRGGDYVPFSAWIPRIPENIQQPLTIGIPILIGVTALATAYFNTYGKKSGSAINFYLLYCAVDTLLSCAVYGILIYGSF